MRRRPPRSTRVRSSAASDVYKRQGSPHRRRAVAVDVAHLDAAAEPAAPCDHAGRRTQRCPYSRRARRVSTGDRYRWGGAPVSYTHLRAHETVLDLVCRLLLEKKK